jgi:hypothetical protein
MRGFEGNVALGVAIAGKQEIDPDRSVHVGSGFERLRVHAAGGRSRRSSSPPPALRFVPSAPATEPQTRQRGRLRIAERRNGERDAVRDDYSFFSSFLTSAFTFSQKDSLGAFLHASPRATIIFSVPSMLTPALSGLPPWP